MPRILLDGTMCCRKFGHARIFDRTCRMLGHARMFGRTCGLFGHARRTLAHAPRPSC